MSERYPRYSMRAEAVRQGQDVLESGTDAARLGDPIPEPRIYVTAA